MLRFIIYKIFNKKWLNASLLSGVILLTAFLCIYPMFREGSLNRMIQDSFKDYTIENEEFPVIMNSMGELKDAKYASLKTLEDELDSKADAWGTKLGLTELSRQKIVYINAGYSDCSFASVARQVKAGYIADVKNHAILLDGCWPDEASSSDNEFVKEELTKGAIPCVMSQPMMDKYDFVVGETISYSVQYQNAQHEIRMVICGIIAENSGDGIFWKSSLQNYASLLLMDNEGFEEMLKYYCDRAVEYEENVMYDYREINSKNVDDVILNSKRIRKNDGTVSDNYERLLNQYNESKKSITVILFTFELPIVALLLLFLYMISGQILEMETTEIAMLKSRGISRIKIILLYLLQSSVIAAAGIIIGTPIGYLLCKLAASTDAFLTFTFKDVSLYKPNPEMLLFALLSFGLAVLFMTIPVISLSKFTITENRNRRIKVSDLAFWEKYFLDIPIVALAAYLLFNYNKQVSTISEDIVNGGNVDPIMFLNSSLFILGCGLLALRIIHLLVKLIYRIGRKKWKPAEYVSFLQIIRNSKKQGFISVFLVMTIAMGVFNANLARSVNENMEQRIRYNNGADFIVNEKWNIITIKSGDPNNSYVWNYREPDFNRFNVLYDLGVEKMTKVIFDEKTNVTVNNKVTNDCTLMGINSKEFGETASLKSGLNDTHWYNYLNKLAEKNDGVLISSNLAEKYELKVGDTINYSRPDPLDPKKFDTNAKGEICGIVDAFPGYETVEYKEDDSGVLKATPNYLVVANYSTVVKSFRMRPYSVWMKLSENADTDAILDELKNSGMTIRSSIDTEGMVEDERNSAMLQITNGMFSVGFIISIIICGVGFMIYWVLTIKERELIYGIYRAMGLTMGEIVRMLVVEQVFSSLFAALGGFGVGILTTQLFTKLISVVYLPREHNLPIEIFSKAEDSIKMLVAVGIVLVACFVVIYRIIKQMNITKALKLGED